MKNYILKIDCNDEKGLIYRISDIIFKHNLNIETNSEFVDHENRRFFFRAEIFSDVELNISAFYGNLSFWIFKFVFIPLQSAHGKTPS